MKEVKKVYEEAPESIKKGFGNMSTKYGKRTQSLILNTFGFYPSIIQAFKSNFLATFIYKKEEEKLISIQKLVSPEEGNENYPYSKKIKNFKYVDKHGKKTKMSFVYGQGIFYFSFKKIGENQTLFENFYCKNYIYIKKVVKGFNQNFLMIHFSKLLQNKHVRAILQTFKKNQSI
jgi:hypothetical protein